MHACICVRTWLRHQAAGCRCSWFYLGGMLGEYDENWRFAAVARTSGNPDVLLAEHHWDAEDT